MPTHELKEGSLSGTGAQVDYSINVTDASFPIAATLIIPALSGAWAFSPDFDLYLFSPGGTLLASAELVYRQEEIGYNPDPAKGGAGTGAYTLRVRSYSGSGGYFVDVSAGLTPPPPPPPDTIPPAQPQNLTATAADASVSLKWNANSEPDVAGYRVYRRNADGTWPTTPIATTPTIHAAASHGRQQARSALTM
jgi:hypothetical protein